MTLKEFKDYIEQLPEGSEFKHGISEPFSWRGIYSEVAFAIAHNPMSREEILSNIEKAYTEKFYGYKGGEFKYNDGTPVHFEEDHSAYSDGGYCAEMIARIAGGDLFKSQEDRLVNVAFPKP